jgi:hypothetical protein
MSEVGTLHFFALSLGWWLEAGCSSARPKNLARCLKVLVFWHQIGEFRGRVAMQSVMRIIIGVLGLQFIALGLWLWMVPELAGGALGLTATGPLGIATIRADIGSLFIAMGGFSAFAAWRQAPAFLLAPMVILGLAIVARIITLLTEGVGLIMLPPLVIEIVLLALMVAAQRLLKPPTKLDQV